MSLSYKNRDHNLIICVNCSGKGYIEEECPICNTSKVNPNTDEECVECDNNGNIDVICKECNGESFISE